MTDTTTEVVGATPMTEARRARLATRCLFCRKPLCDAVSVQAGVGPECRKRHGVAADAEGRSLANQLTAQAALLAEEGRVTEVLEVADALERAAFAQLAVRIRERFVDIRVRARQDGYLVQVPFDLRWNRAMYQRHLGRWQREHKGYVVGPAQRQALWQLMQEVFPGRQGLAPEGHVFTIPSRAQRVA